MHSVCILCPTLSYCSGQNFSALSRCLLLQLDKYSAGDKTIATRCPRRATVFHLKSTLSPSYEHRENERLRGGHPADPHETEHQAARRPGARAGPVPDSGYRLRQTAKSVDGILSPGKEKKSILVCSTDGMLLISFYKCGRQSFLGRWFS